MSCFEVLGLLQGSMGALLSCIVLWKYYTLFFKTWNQGILKVISWITYYVWQVANTVTVYNLQTYVNSFVRVIFILIVGIISYKGTFAVKVLFAMVLSVSWILVELIATLILLFTNHYFSIGTMVRRTGLTKIVLMSVIAFLYKIVGIKNDEWNIKPFHNMVLFLVPFGTILVVINMFYFSNEWDSKESILLMLIITVMMLVANVGAIKVYFEFSTQVKFARMNAAYTQQLSVYNFHAKEQENDFLQSQTLRHDMKQQFIYLLALMHKGEMDKGIAYVQELLETKLKVQDRVQTGNFAIDAILNFQAAHAMENKIVFTHQIFVPTQIPVNDTDICIILGNLLDNAIEANECFAGSQYITLTIKWDSGNLFIKMVNTYHQPLKFAKNGNVITTKKDKKMHGIGMASIETIVKKYDGMLKYTYDAKEFTTEILLYNTEK